MAENNFDDRKSDKTALKLLEALKNANAVERFKYLKKKYNRFDPVIQEGNVLYPVELREGNFIKQFLRNMGEDENKWKDKLGLALMYHDHADEIGSGNE